MPHGSLLGFAVKPGPLGYHRATSVSHAVQLLSGYEGTARVIAGGQSLVPMLNMRLIQPDALIDVNQLAELMQARAAGDGTVLGALVRYLATPPGDAARPGFHGSTLRTDFVCAQSGL